MIYLLNSGQPLEQSQGSHRPCSRAALPRKTPTGLEEAPSQLQVAQQGHQQPRSQRSLWLPPKYKQQDGRPLWETWTSAAPPAGGAQARQYIHPSVAWSSKSPFQQGSKKEPGGRVVSQIQLTPEPQLQVTPWKGGWQSFTQSWARSLPSAHMGPRTLGPGCRQRQAGGRTQASQAEPTPEPGPTAPTRPREATEAQGPPSWGPGAVCGMKSHVVPADKPLAMLASKQP